MLGCPKFILTPSCVSDIIKVLSGEKVDVGPTMDDLDDGLQQPDPVEEEEDDSRPERVQSMIVQRPKMVGYATWMEVGLAIF